MRTRALLAGLLVAVAGAGCAFSRLDALELSRHQLARKTVPLYVPSPRAARLIAVGHASSMADGLYLWAIQHFADPPTDLRERSAWLVRVYSTITDLDPKFRDAYWLGYVSLLVEAKDMDAAFALADKALANDPGFTVLAVEAAMAAKRAGRQEDALRYLEIASGTGDKLAHRLLLRLRESETAQAELSAWNELTEDEDGPTRAVARAHVRDLVMLITSAELSSLVECYRRDHGMGPGSLPQLVTAGYAREIPLDPDGKPYVLDARTGAVTPQSPYRYKPPSNSRLGVDLSELGRCAPGSAPAP